MYSEAELESAVAVGTLSPEAADALRTHVSGLRQTPTADEEQFRLVTGFNDVFVSIATLLVLVGAGWLGAGVAGISGGGFLVAAAAWGMAEYFTRRRRMALPSIILLLAFVGGLYAGCLGLYGGLGGGSWWAWGASSRGAVVAQAASAALVVGACWLHWRRFTVPITIAAGVTAIARFAFLLVATLAWPNVGQWMLGLVLLGGLAVFAYAMYWDMGDRLRRTRRSDVAFWLHLAASPMIVHPIFMLMGINLGMKGDGAAVAAVLALLIYAALSVVALIVDRRAILVSALVYVLAAAVYLVSRLGSSGAGFAVAIIVIGSSLLMLSAFWQSMRRALLPLLPEKLSDRVPPADRVAA